MQVNWHSIVFHINTTWSVQLFHIFSYKCGQCDKSFVRRNDLRTHEALHSATLEHICDTCGQKFKRASYLKRHSKTRHEHLTATEDQKGAGIESFYRSRYSDMDLSKTTPHLSCSPLKSLSVDNATAVICSDGSSSRHRFSRSLSEWVIQTLSFFCAVLMWLLIHAALLFSGLYICFCCRFLFFLWLPHGMIK